MYNALKYLSSVLCVTTLVLFAVAYSNHFKNPFHFDDSHTIVNNSAIQSGTDYMRFFIDGSTFSSLPDNQSYRPALTLLNAFNYSVKDDGKINPVPYRITTFVFFTGSGILLYFLLLQILNQWNTNSNNAFYAVTGAGFFLIHTANAETINYIIARGDSISTFFVLLSFVMYLYSGFCRKYFIYLLPVVPGFFIKETALMFIPILIIYVFIIEEKFSFKDILTAKLLTFIQTHKKLFIITLFFSIAILTLYIVKTPATWSSGSNNRLHYLATQPFAMVLYVINFIAPVLLSADTDLQVFTTLLSVKFFVGIIFLLLLLYIMVKTSVSYRIVSFGIAWFIIALLPTSSFIPFAEVMNDHRTFFPYIGLFIIVSVLIKLISEKLTGGTLKSFTFLLIVFSVHAFGIHKRNNVWSSEENLWKDVTEKSPGNSRGLMNYGVALMQKGDYNSAIEYFLKAEKLSPDYAYLQINLGIINSALDKKNEAHFHFNKALILAPGNPECYYYYAEFLKNESQLMKASEVAENGLKISPHHKLLNNLKQTLSVKNNPALITSDLDKAIVNASNNPSPENYLQLSLSFYLENKFEMSIKAAEEAIKLKPDYAEAYNNICAAYNQLEQWELSVKAGEKALEIDPYNILAINNLNFAKEKIIKKR